MATSTTGRQPHQKIGGLTFSASGKFHMDLNRWRGFRRTYGQNHNEWSANYGTGAIANVTPLRVKGFVVPEDGFSLKSVALILERTETADGDPWEFSTTIARAGVLTEVSRLTSVIATTTNQFLSESIDYPLIAGDVILVTGRRTAGSATRRHAFASITIHAEKT